MYIWAMKYELGNFSDSLTSYMFLHLHLNLPKINGKIHANNLKFDFYLLRKALKKDIVTS